MTEDMLDELRVLQEELETLSHTFDDLVTRIAALQYQLEEEM